MICRVKIDGSNQETLYQNKEYVYHNLVAVKEKLFFQAVPSGDTATTGTIFSMNMDGSRAETVAEGQYILHGIDSNWLYYSDLNGENPKLCRMDLTTEKTEGIIDDFQAFIIEDIVLDHGKVYYRECSDSVPEEQLMLSCYDLKSGDIENVCQVSSRTHNFMVNNGFLYYIDHVLSPEGWVANIMKTTVDGIGEPELVREYCQNAVIFSYKSGVASCLFGGDDSEITEWEFGE